MTQGSAKPQIGKLALDRGLLTFDQLSEAIREQERRRSAGGQLPMGEILIEMELISRRQLETLLKNQGRPQKKKQPIEGFELLRKLGEGGMGATYLARHTSMDRMVALKVLRKRISRDGEFVNRFVREARLAGRLNHVNIVHAQDVGQSGGFHYLVMEYVEGKNAFSMIPAGKGLDEELALHLCMQVGRALDYANESGIVHRDIKPDNIMVTAEHIAKLCDFGLARDTAKQTRMTQTGMMMGTPHYVSPEQARGSREVDIRSDIYSLGATLYHMVTGATPFTGSSAAVVMSRHLTEQMPWPQDVNPDLSENICMLIEKMMAKEPADRYQTPAELLADMERVIDGKSPRIRQMAGRMSSIGKSGSIQVGPGSLNARKRLERMDGVEPRPESGEFVDLEAAEWLDVEDAAELPANKPRPTPARAPLAEGDDFVPFGLHRESVAKPEPEPEPELEPGPEPEPEGVRTPRPQRRRNTPVGTARRGDTRRGLRPVRERKAKAPVAVYAGVAGVLVLMAAGMAALMTFAGKNDGKSGLPPPPGRPTVAVESNDPLTVKVKQLFRGKLVRFNPQTLQAELFYDFASAEEVKDFTADLGTVSPAAGNLLLKSARAPLGSSGPKGTSSLRHLAVLSGDAFASSVMVFGRKEVLSVGLGSPDGKVTILARACAVSGRLMGGRLSRLNDNDEVADLKASLSPIYLPGNKARVALTRSGNILTARFDRHKFTHQTTGTGLGQMQAILHSAVYEGTGKGTISLVSELRVSGTLDKTWLDAELAKLAPKPK